MPTNAAEIDSVIRKGLNFTAANPYKFEVTRAIRFLNYFELI